MPPLIVVELLSEGTEKEDLGLTVRDADGPPVKWDVYERILGIPYYAVFSRDADELRVFVLKNGKYSKVTDHNGRLWIPEAGLFLGLRRGDYKGHNHQWLRWCDADGNWIPTGEERAETGIPARGTSHTTCRTSPALRRTGTKARGTGTSTC